MSVFLPSPEVLLLVGPALLGLMAFLETSLPIGLLVPAGVALALGAFLAREGYLPLPTVVAASAVGALAGDWTGYWLGRLRRTSVLHRLPGPVGRLALQYELPTARAIQARPFWTVTLGRTVSFVRTLMPAAVGRSGMTFPRFVAYDLLGIAVWLVLYVSIGLLAGASWKAMSGLIGTGWALVLVGGGLTLVLVRRWRGQRPGPPGDVAA